MAKRPTPTAVIFDIGRVLFDWDLRHLYAKLIADEAELDAFLRDVVTAEWHFQHDAGRPFAHLTHKIDTDLLPDIERVLEQLTPIEREVRSTDGRYFLARLRPYALPLLVLVVTQALSQVVSAAFVTPFTASVTSLQYLDQRMRKEAYDVELMSRAGLTG